MSELQPYEVLLYYNFVPVPDPQQERETHEAKCLELGLLGRIFIGAEGLNGTVSGPAGATAAYRAWLGAHPVFHATEFKVEQVPGHTFLKLHVRVKKEIVNFGVEGLNPSSPLENYVEPEEFRQILRENRDDVVILDARSNYETRVGRFRGAISFDIQNFRELPDKLREQAEALRGKKVYTYCTGGIKCEKVSRFMKELGIDEVYQLHGGIIRYALEAGGENFEGACYVFDQRVVTPVNQVNPVVMGQCSLCAAPTEKMLNCANPECNEQVLLCKDCAVTMEGCCSETCKAHPRRRSFDGRGYYLRGVNSKLYAQNPDPNYLRRSSLTYRPVQSLAQK